MEQLLVTDLAARDGGFELTLDSGERARARRVVVAAGVEHFAWVPQPLAALPPWLCTPQLGQHTGLAGFRGQEVIVVGAGQSALETAALLHENGATSQLVARTGRLAWNGAPLPPDRPLPQRLREPEAGLGSGWATWFYSNHPDMFRHLPAATRVYRARTALGPAGASWLRPRVDGQFPVLTGYHLEWATAQDGGVRLGLAGPGRAGRTLAADHVIAATGYQADAARLPFIGGALRSGLRTLAGTPVVGHDYQSSVPGLYFDRAGRGADLRAGHALRVRVPARGGHGGGSVRWQPGIPPGPPARRRGGERMVTPRLLSPTLVSPAPEPPTSLPARPVPAAGGSGRAGRESGHAAAGRCAGAGHCCGRGWAPGPGVGAVCAGRPDDPGR